MRASRSWGRSRWLAPFALLLAACSHPGADGSAVGSSSAAQDLGDTVSEPGLFSYQAPKGWPTATLPENEYSSCSGPAEGSFTPTILVSQNGYQSVDDYVKSYTAKLNGSPNKVVEQGSFETSGGVKGMRIVVKNESSPPEDETISYVFSGRAGLLLAVDCTCLSADDSQFRSLYDASMKSLVFGDDAK